jgi:putative ATPase
VLFGPPGTGKTTLARLMASVTGRRFLELNATEAKVADVRALLEEARADRSRGLPPPIVFLDELPVFNRSQQTVLLPGVEKGDCVLVGTTTENPRFELNKMLLSRLVVLRLEPLQPEEILPLLQRALSDPERGLGGLGLSAEPELLLRLARACGGDARAALTRLEFAARGTALRGGQKLTEADLEETGPALLRYDRAGDDHYATISALIKSIRGSDPDASVYWLARMLAAGDDLRFIARRLCILAAEDVGLADPFALVLANSAAEAAERIGLPEARIVLSEAVLYLAGAPKSNSAYLAVDAAARAVESGDLLPVPEHLRPDGRGYVYPHDDPRRWVPQAYLTEPRRFWHPVFLGAEARMTERLKRFWKRFREEGEP